MREYETIYICKPLLTDEGVKAVKEKLVKLIQDMNGKVLKIEEWGKRKLAFPMKKNSKGIYYLINYAGTREIVNELERNLRIMDDIIRYLTVKIKDQVDPEKLKAEIYETSVRKVDVYLGVNGNLDDLSKDKPEELEDVEDEGKGEEEEDDEKPGMDENEDDSDIKD